jgi:hypothetical protein
VRGDDGVVFRRSAPRAIAREKKVSARRPLERRWVESVQTVCMRVKRNMSGADHDNRFQNVVRFAPARAAQLPVGSPGADRRRRRAGAVDAGRRGPAVAVDASRERHRVDTRRLPALGCGAGRRRRTPSGSAPKAGAISPRLGYYFCVFPGGLLGSQEDIMPYRSPIATTALAAALMMVVGGAAAFDETRYPELKGQWVRAGNVGLLAGGSGGIRYDTSNPPDKTHLNLGQKPPLTPEYQAIYDDNLDDMAKGGQGIDPTATCVSPGMPRVMIDYLGFEVVVTADITYILMERDHDHLRHIYTDGRSFPAGMADNPQFLGYSIGKWLDEDGDGRYDVLEVETRGLKGPRVYDATGIPLHADNDTVINERIYLDRVNPNLLHDDITTTDHALTRPWLVKHAYRRVVTDKPIWFGHAVCGEANNHVVIGTEHYFRSADGQLMPTKKGQKPPDLRYSTQAKGQ